MTITGGKRFYAMAIWLSACILHSCKDAPPLTEANQKDARQLQALSLKGEQLRKDCQFAEATICQLECVRLAKKTRDTLQWVTALNELGTNYRRLGALNEAVESYHWVLYLTMDTDREHNRQVHDNRLKALNGLGNTYLSLNIIDMADSVLRISLEGEQRSGNLLGQAANMANLGNIKEAKGELDSAWFYYKESLRLSEQCKSPLGVALCHNYFGQLYEKEGKLDDAFAEYETAYRQMEENNDQWHAINPILDMARIHILKHDYDEARNLLTKANETACQIGSVEHQIEVQRLFFRLFDSLGDKSQALRHYIRADQMDDSLLGRNKLIQIHNTRVALERQFRAEERDIAANELAHEQNINLIIVVCSSIAIVLAIGFIIMLWYALHIRGVKQKLDRQTLRAQESFFTNITHEFRTPLTVILGLSHQLEDDEIEDMQQVRSSAKMIVRQSNSLLSLINQLLDISKVRSAIGMAKWRRGDIVAFIAMAIDNYKPYANSKRIELTFSHSLTAIEMDFVPDYVQKIISNLLSNAIKYTPSHGKVNVTLERTSGSHVKLQVFDTGMGIEAENLPHIFNAFYQTEKGRQEIGTGIGLSLVKLTVEAMNGDIEVQSIPNQGSTFTVTLPITTRQDSQPISSEQPVADIVPQTDSDFYDGEANDPLPSPSPTELTTRILIVEDNQDIAYYIGMHLQQMAQLIYARTGDEAIEKARETVPDLIITDLMMPGDIDGLQLCRIIRHEEYISQVPIIIITAKTTEADRVKGLEAGADAYFVKPFNSEELLVRVKKLLERQSKLREMLASQQPDETLQVEKLSADDRQFMNRVTDIIYRLMAQGKTDVDSIASQMALSRSQLNRRLLAITGQNTSVYVMRLRIAKAKRLLKGSPELPIGNVAVKCGFDDVAYFSRIFKQNCGMTPSQYRKRI